jgi:Tfp pilus assembly protein PilE
MLTMMVTAVVTAVGFAALATLAVPDVQEAAERSRVDEMESALCSRAGCDVETRLTED